MTDADTRRLVRVNAIAGSAKGDGWPARLQSAHVDVLRLDQAEAVKSRLRKRTEGGVDVAISLDRGERLRDGDVLFWDPERRTAIVTSVQLADVMVIDLNGVAVKPLAEAMATCVELGHALGNQHWGLVVKGLRAYVPLAIASPVMSSVMKTHAFAGVSYTFVPGAEVSGLTAGEARRLFGTDHAASHVHPAAPQAEEAR